MRVARREVNETSRNITDNFVRNAIRRFRLETQVDRVIDIIDNDKPAIRSKGVARVKKAPLLRLARTRHAEPDFGLLHEDPQIEQQVQEISGPYFLLCRCQVHLKTQAERNVIRFKDSDVGQG